jgi:hypothetical protein
VRKLATKTKCQELVELLGFDNVYEAIAWYKEDTDALTYAKQKEINRLFGMG